jgi:uncharacterized protein involved in exopolysaccharide biosynthesis
MSVSQIAVAGDARRPSLPGALAGLGALAANSDPLSSPAVVANLLTSRAVLDPVLRRSFAVTGGTEATLATIVLGAPVRAPGDYVRAREMMSGGFKAAVDPRTNLITFSVELRDPVLARDVNVAVLDESDRALQRMRREQTGQRRRQTELRLASTRQQLAQAEDAQRAFYQQNVVATAPSLALEERRLQRVLDLRQEVFSTLTRDYEQLLQDEARTLPALAQFLAPEVPARKSKPSGSLLVAAGLVGGVFVAVLLTLVGLLRAAPGALDAASGAEVLRAAVAGSPRRRA